MSSFVNSLEYEITSEAEVSGILSHFEKEQILDLVDDNLKRKHIFRPNNPINLVASLETNFTILYSKFPGEKERIDNLREDTYRAIIYKLCNYYNLQFNENNQDIYTIAYYLYDFLVSNFSTYVVNFFANYIIKEKDYLYNCVGLIEMKKNKDMSSIYSKKIHKDSKLAIINANIEYVIEAITAFDIDLNTILSLVYSDINIINLISSIISPIHDIFKDHFVPIVNNQYKPIFLTNVKMTLISYDNIISEETLKFIKGE